MPKLCSAFGCNNRQTPSKSIFKFPKDPDRRKTWLSNINRDDLNSKMPDQLLSGGYGVCEDHFAAHMIIQMNKRKRPTAEAVPYPNNDTNMCATPVGGGPSVAPPVVTRAGEDGEDTEDCVAPYGHNTNEQPESVTGNWEDGKQCSGNEYLETERNTDQLLKVSPALQPPPTNAAVNTSELPVPAEQACQQLERKRRRKMTTPRKVCTQEELDEGDLNIFQRPMFPCLKPPASHKRTAPSRRIKKARLSAVCHGQTTSSKSQSSILNPQSSKKHHPTILWRKKSGSTPLLRDDRSSKITAAAHIPSGPAHLQASSPQSTQGPSTAERPADTSESPLRMHGLSVEDYRRVYHSVVDPMLCTASGNPQRPNLELGRVIKQRLWEPLFCPQLHEEVGPDGRVTITETFNHSAYYRHAPHVELDMSTYPNTQTGGEKEKHTKQETSD